jgi:N-carbamoylputrescine amidase
MALSFIRNPGMDTRVAVTEFPNEERPWETAWSVLVANLEAFPADVLVLPELPFVEWKAFTSREVTRVKWNAIMNKHREWECRLDELDVRSVCSSRPVERHGKRFNEAFVWSTNEGTKYYLPEGDDGWEATWFEREPLAANILVTEQVNIGFQLCTEITFSELAWQSGRNGAHLIAAPRATGGHLRWRAAASLSATMSGAYLASANRCSFDGNDFTGTSWIVSPEGEILAETSVDMPYAVVSVNLSSADNAKLSYPRNIPSPVHQTD